MGVPLQTGRRGVLTLPLNLERRTTLISYPLNRSIAAGASNADQFFSGEPRIAVHAIRNVNET
jgi:hypothetical protein